MGYINVVVWYYGVHGAFANKEFGKPRVCCVTRRWEMSPWYAGAGKLRLRQRCFIALETSLVTGQANLSLAIKVIYVQRLGFWPKRVDLNAISHPL